MIITFKNKQYRTDMTDPRCSQCVNSLDTGLSTHEYMQRAERCAHFHRLTPGCDNVRWIKVVK